MKIKNRIEVMAFALIPLIECILFAALQGMSLLEINPLASTWNDEVFYYKQIEGMVFCGDPLGYFGYNGSSAAIGTLGAWPKFILLPYVLLGHIFGITPYHMIIFNILFMIIAFGVFYYLVKPELWQSVVVAFLFFSFPAPMRYIMSGMVETLFLASLIVLVALLIYFQKGKYGRISLGVAYFLVLYSALCRPWFLIFIVIPVVYHFKISKKESILMSCFVIILFAVTYVFYVMPRCAPYLYSTIDLHTFSVLFESGIFEFIKEVITVTVHDWKVLVYLYMLKERSFYAAALFSLIIVLVAIIIAIIVLGVNSKTIKSEKIITGIITIIVSICIVWALILFYTEEQVSRHIMSLIIGLQMLLVMYYLPKNKPLIIGLITLLTCVGWQYHGDSYTFLLPNDYSEGRIIEDDREVLEKAFEIVEDGSPWENTVLYIFQGTNTNYCYYLPKGCGLNLCMDSYISAVYESTPAKYILTNYHERLFLMNETGWEVIAQGQEFVLCKKR